MLDAVTLDQLRTFLAAAEQGSFSAAGRKLRRAQSVVSQTLANLELQLGVTLFDRSARYPQLTDAGRALLVEARAVAEHMDTFKARARSVAEGLEPELSVVVDVMFPMQALTRAAAHSGTASRTRRCGCTWKCWAVSSSRCWTAPAGSAWSVRCPTCPTNSRWNRCSRCPSSLSFRPRMPWPACAAPCRRRRW
jgi:hypothetical protein